MDPLGHVNNVIWADYLQEARLDFLASTGRPELLYPLLASQQLNYLRPLTFDSRPVLVDVWVSAIGTKSFELSYEVFRDGPEGRTAYLRAHARHVAWNVGGEGTRALSEDERAALSRWLEPTPHEALALAEARPDHAVHYPLHVRLSDIDLGGIVNNVKYLEYFQEARIALLSRQMNEVEPGVLFPTMVIAQADVRYESPILRRAEAYDCRTWVSALGTKSMTVEAQIADGDAVKSRGRFVLVFFDLESGRAAAPDPRFRAVIERELA